MKICITQPNRDVYMEKSSKFVVAHVITVRRRNLPQLWQERNIYIETGSTSLGKTQLVEYEI
jgi:hypothetical protein